MEYIFMSYAHKDSEWTIPIFNRMQEDGFEIWYDKNIEGASVWDENIADHIDKCSYFIAFLSHNYMESDNCQDELNYARDVKVEDLLLIYHDESIHLSPGMKMRLSRRQALFYDSYSNEDLFYEELYLAKGITRCRTAKIEKNWQPDRKKFTIAEPASNAVFNSIIDNPLIGDERSFVKIRKKAEGEEYTVFVELEVGQTYEVFIYYHNNASYSEISDKTIGIANDVVVKSSFPKSLNVGDKGIIDGTIDASNTEPSSVSASVSVRSSQGVYLRYVKGSAIIHNGGKLNGSNIGPDYLFKSGAMLGYDDFNGLLAGGIEYAGYITYDLFVDAPGFEVKNTVVGDRILYGPGDIVTYKIGYKNTGTMDQKRVVVRDLMPSELHYVKGSTVLFNNNLKYGKGVNDNLVSSHGMNIGDYAGGSGWAEITYKAEIDKTIESNNYIIEHSACVSTSDGNKTASASFMYSKDFSEDQDWGPERETYTVDNRPTYALFNSILDDPIIGDERRFIYIRELNKRENQLERAIEVIPGRQYVVHIFFHNDAHYDTNKLRYGVATIARVSTSFPKCLTRAQSGKIGGAISWSYVTEDSPKQNRVIWDSIYLTTTYEKVFLHYVLGSAKIHNKGDANESILPISLFSSGGTLIGINKLQGVIPGGEEFYGHVTYVLQAELLSGTIEIAASLDGINFGRSVEAFLNNEVYFKITVKNNGYVALNNACVKCLLPEGLSLVGRSVRFAANDSGIWEKLSDNITSNGYNFGKVGNGNHFDIVFKAEVYDESYEKNTDVVVVSELIYDSNEVMGEKKEDEIHIHLKS